jgi:hypothetical protein
MKINFLKAFNGDSILISFVDKEGENRNILIDGGISETYKLNKGPKGKPVYGELKTTIDSIRNSNVFIDLLIITHIDDDHIGGILKWFDEDIDAYKIVKKVWFNSGGLIANFLNEIENIDLRHFINPLKDSQTSVNQGIEFSEYIFDKRIWDREIKLQTNIIKTFGLEFKILSPNNAKINNLLKDWRKKDPDLLTAARENDYRKSLKEYIESDIFEQDNATPNGSSIAFVLNYEGNNLLFLGDSHPTVIIEGLNHFGYSENNPIKAELVKISHHGSKGNTNVELLKCIDSKKYVISTDGRSHEHPHKQCLARLINEKRDCNIYFNYKERMEMIFSKQDKIDFPEFNVFAITNDFEL